MSITNVTDATMLEPMQKLLILYTPADSAQKKRLLVHLEPLVWDRTVSKIYDHALVPVPGWLLALEQALLSADGLLLLITANFGASPIFQEPRVLDIIQRHVTNGLTIVPVLVNHFDWASVPWFSRFHPLPADGKPVMSRRPPDKAWTHVAKEIRRAIHCAAAARAGAEAISSTRLPPVPPHASLARLLGELPGETDELFGRDEDLAWLDSIASSKVSAVVALTAFGGVGKSALVRHWLARHFANQSSFRFLGCSFYSQGTREHAGTSDQFLLHVLESLGDSTSGRGSSWERGQRLAQLVAAQPTILVLDGMEPLQYGPGPHGMEGRLKDLGILGMLTSLVNNPGKCLCLLTSRLRFTDQSLQVRSFVQRPLELLSPVAACQLLQSRGVRGTEQELHQAAEYLGHHALALVLAAEYVHTFEQSAVNRIRTIPLTSEKTREGRHAKSVLAAYDLALSRDGDPVDLELLYLMGLFERPARWNWLQAIWARPSIPGVTDRLAEVSEGEIWESISRLRQWGLVVSLGQQKEPVLDAHPLIREYFGVRLCQKNIVGWRQAHGRVFECLVQQAEEYPDTLEQMEPLLHAVMHGCRAGRHQDALNNIFLRRIMRGERYYAAHELGIYNPLLSTLTYFFENGNWGQPVKPNRGEWQGLGEQEQYIVLTQAAMYLSATRGFATPEVHAALSAAQSLCCDEQQRFQVLRMMWSYHLIHADDRFREALRLSEQCFEIAERLQDTALLLEGWVTRGVSYFYLSDMPMCHQSLSNAINLYDKSKHAKNFLIYSQDPGSICLSYDALALTDLGYLDQALSRTRRATELAFEVGHAFSLSMTLCIRTMVHEDRGEYQEALEWSDRARHFSAKQGFAFFGAIAHFYNGWAISMLGNIESGAKQMRDAYSMYETTGSSILRVQCLIMLARVLASQNKPEEALQCIDDAKIAIKQHGDRIDSELYRAEGDILLIASTNNYLQASECYENSLEIARKNQTKLYELRTICCWARLLVVHGKRKRALAMLRDITEWFTEGIDCYDIKIAKRLLADIHGIN